ncbi:MAG: hypothetical protein ACODAD_08825 [Planctomycetota bacterium]
MFQQHETRSERFPPGRRLAALPFLYREVPEQDFGWLDDLVRTKRPLHIPVPVVLTPTEALALLANLIRSHRLIAKSLYGSGWWVMGCLR